MKEIRRSSSDPAPSSSSGSTPRRDGRRPFVAPKLRCETELVRGTSDRTFFETTSS